MRNAQRWLDWFRRRRRHRLPDENPSGKESPLSKEIAAEFSSEELLEFLEFAEGDLYPTQADPAFKERLRADLRKLVQTRYGTGSIPGKDD